jgi:hypothetical protein
MLLTDEGKAEKQFFSKVAGTLDFHTTVSQVNGFNDVVKLQALLRTL